MTEPPHDSRLARVKRGENSMRHPVGVMICPRCERPLQGCDHALGIAWRCGKCGGQSLNFSQFRRMVPEEGADAIWDNATARPDPPHRSTRCPECHTRMDAIHIPLQGRQIELDICRPCQRLWLDRQEDDGIASFSLTPEPVPGLARRRRSWLTPRELPRRREEEIQRDVAYHRLLRRADKAERESESRWALSSLGRAVVVGIIVFFMAWRLPAYFQVRLVLVAMAVYFSLRMLRR